MRKNHHRPTPGASAGHPNRPNADHDPRRTYRKALLRALRELTHRGRRA